MTTSRNAFLAAATVCGLVLATCSLASADVIYVKADAAGANDGSSWENAFVDLQDALTAATAGDEIWVAAATYTPAPPGGDRDASFELVSGVGLYGGFAGDETSLDERDIELHVTILSGDLNADDGPDFENNDENSEHVVISTGADATAVLDGFTITAGNAGVSGGGLHGNPPGSATIANCSFIANTASYAGGGCNVGNGLLTNCTFADNSASLGGAVNANTSTFVNCTFLNNTADRGGAFTIDSGIAHLYQCTLAGNSATESGGAIYAEFGADVHLTNCLVTANTAQEMGGAVFVESNDSSISIVSVYNCAVVGNTAFATGGMYAADGRVYARNSILWGNSDDGNGPEIAQIGAGEYGEVYVDYNCIQGWGGTLGGEGNHGDDPLFIDADGPDDILGTEDDNLRLSIGSPAIDAASNDLAHDDDADLDEDGDFDEPVPLDLDWRLRFVDDPESQNTGEGQPPIVDMGPYEFGSVCPDDGGEERVHNVTQGTNFVTIRCGIEFAVEGDVIEVDPGTYFENLFIANKDIIVRSTNPRDPTIVAATIIDGGGVGTVVTLSSGTISGFTIQNGSNSTSDGGGGVQASGTAVVRNNVITGNSSDTSGGGVAAFHGAVVGKNWIIDNSAGDRGGGVLVQGSAFLIDNLILENSSEMGGGGVEAAGDAVVRNNTIVGNETPGNGGGVLAGGSAVLLNNIIIQSPQGSGVHVIGDAPVTADFNCVFGNASGEYSGGAVPGPNDIDVDPLLDADSVHLTADSPCLDSGDPEFHPLPGETDIDGDTRVFDDRVDIGADEAADCNGNGVQDYLDIAEGTSEDCDGNGIPDECEDCNGNGVGDSCDITEGTSQDCNDNGIPDECIDLEEDCNDNAVPDACDIDSGASQDCNDNGIPDECIELEEDCNDNGIPDECEADCNGNGVADSCDIAGGTSLDCNGNGIPDECDIASGTSQDCNANGVPDACDITAGTSQDCDEDGIPDECWFREVLYGVGNGPYSVAIGDLDGDGDADLAVANTYSYDVSVLLNDGDGTFAEDVLYGAGIVPYSVAIGDLDGDGDADLAVAVAASGNVSVLLNYGDGTFAEEVVYDAGAIPVSVAIGDLDGDGDADLAVANSGLYGGGDNVSVLLNNGDGTFATDVLYAVGDGPLSVAIGDLDADGDADLAVANNDSDNVSVLLNNGDGTFATDVLYGAGEYPRSVAIGDLDGDGDADLAVANGSDDVSVLLNDGDGTFADDVLYDAGDGPRSVAIGDLDGDGDADLAVANFSSDDVSVLLNQAPCPCEGDANGDGLVDPLDSGFVLARFGCDVGAGDPDCDLADMNGDGLVDPLDVGYILARFGPCP